MTKKFLSFLAISFLLISCGTGGNKEASNNHQEQDPVKVEFASLIANPADYVGKNISVEGKVVHVCLHSGKKLFITGDDPDIRLYIQAGEEMPKFPTGLLGSEIVVEGKLIRPVAAAVETHEETLSSSPSHAEAGAVTCETEKALASQTALADLMMVYSSHMVLK